MTIYLKDATYIDWKTLQLKKTHIAVDTDRGHEIEFPEGIPSETEAAETDIVLDCRNKLITRSFGCGHHHIYSALARGMPAPRKKPENFLEILKYIWWTLDRNLDADSIRASALSTALYCAKNGVTVVIDHHASPFAVRGSLDIIRESFEMVGVSHLLCYEISDRDGEQSREEGLAETEDFLKAGHPGLVGLHASFTVNDETLRRTVDLAGRYNSGIHVHVAEGRADQEDCLEKYKKRVIQRFSEAGVLDFSKTLLVHCLHLDETEAEQVRNSKAWVVQNIESNLNNNVGLTDYGKYGDRVMLGTDGMHSDMLRSVKAAFFTGQTTEGIDFKGAYDRFRNIQRYIEENSVTNHSADSLVILDYDSPTDVTSENFIGHLLFGIDSRHVESVISNGKLIVKNREIRTVDENEILEFSREMGRKLWEKMKQA